MFRIDDASAAVTLPTPESAGTEGYFTEGNPVAGTPATLVRASFLNMIQEELRAIIIAGGLTPSKTTYNQLLTALRSAGVFQTPAQFDNSTKSSTTAFVQRAMGNYSGFANFSSDQTLTNDLLGKLLVPNTAGSMTINLNSKASSVPGSSFTIFNSGSGIVTVNPQSGDLLQAGYAAVASLLIEAGSYACITNVGGQWIAAGSATLKYEGAQKVLFTGSGYQRFPSGMIMQWGSIMSSTSGAATFTYPMAFPNAYICGSVSAIATVPVAPVFNQVPTQAYSQVDVYSISATPVRVATTSQIILFGY